MPRRSPAHHHHHHDHHYCPPASAAHHAGRGQRPADYTLVHAGRRLRFGPIAFWIVVGTLVIMAVWTITTVTYFAFREDVITRLISRQRDMQSGYEDRIAELRVRIDRISGRQLLDQEQYEKKLDDILRRQSALEARANALHGLGEVTGSLKQRGAAGEPRTVPLKGSLINDKGALLFPALGGPDNTRSRIFAGGAGGVAGTIARLQASLDRIEQRETGMLNTLARNYDAKAQRMRGVLAELGFAAGRAAATDAAGGMGGPFLPAPAAQGAAGFERQIQHVRLARTQVARLTRALDAVPVRKPLNGEADLVSGFGVRADPFHGSPAMHTGLDLRGEIGDPVRATADGRITTAGWSGGYGRAVDVDHGNGLVTRYGHLSAIEVRVGQAIKRGQIIGRIGSTGRSTGPHLHYETRLHGEAVDPQKFLRAGERLAGVM